MKTKRAFAALICGYGVPKDIFSDPNYAAYLHPVFNRLISRYGGATGIIVVNGGATDLRKPYLRTEAGEIKKWLTARIQHVVRSGQAGDWNVSARPKSLTTLENLLNFAESIEKMSNTATDGDVLVFCEATRAARVRRLTREIPALRRANVVPIDFDASPRRYDAAAIRASERDFLALELAALRDPAALARLRRFAREKLRLLRQHPPEQAHAHLAEILERLHAEYKARFRDKKLPTR